MPEYLSPAVYVEEVDLGPKPIEGVSTSTAGMVGVTERGPEDVPVLVTSFAEYQRVYGAYLRVAEHPETWAMPHAVEGFFQNGGQRLYTVRVASAGAQTAQVVVMARGAAGAYAGELFSPAATGNTFLLVAGAAPAAGSVLRIGATGDYVLTGGAPPAANRLVAVGVPLASPHGQGEPVDELPALAAPNPPVNLAGDTPAGVNAVRVDADHAGGPWAVGDVVEVGMAGPPDRREMAVISGVRRSPGGITLTLRTTLAFAHADGDDVTFIDAGAAGATVQLSQGTGAGDVVVLADNALAAGTPAVRFGAGATAEYRRVVALEARRLEQATRTAHAAGSDVRLLTLADAGGDPPGRVLDADAPVGTGEIELADTTGLAVGDWVHVLGADPEYAVVTDLPADRPRFVVLRQPLQFGHAAADAVRLQAVAAAGTYVAQRVDAGADIVVLADAVPAGANVLDIGPAGSADADHAEIGAVVNPAVVDLAAGPVSPAGAVAEGHAAGAPLFGLQALLTLHAVDRGEWGNELRVRVAEDGASVVHTTASAFAGPGNPVPLMSVSGVEPGTVLEFIDLTTTVAAYAVAGSRVVAVTSRAGINVGDRLRLGRTDAEPVTVAALPAAPANQLVLEQPVTRAHQVGEAVDRMDVATGEPVTAKVAGRNGNQVVLQAPGLPAAVNAGTLVRSREFRLAIEWVKRGAANPRTPGSGRIVESELHRNLSLDDRHSRYIGTVIGRVDGPIRLWDRRPEGQSDLVRVEDPLFGQAGIRTQIRIGPDIVFEDLPGGRRRPMGRWLQGGDDDDANVGPMNYQGQDNIDPLLRTGLQSLKNEEGISLVAIPGRWDAPVQQQVVDHCELMRYRVAVLDSEPGDTPTGARLPEVQAQRQQFDSKYAALYYPWLRVSDPVPATPSNPDVLTVPPSGHVLGVYARTDVTRGVHKAPANEVVRGIVGLQRSITKGEHDVLNPSPMNINVLRDFREQQRGLRVWGARIITSDTEWRYLNVRRLFNYIERSIEIGTQWVVFEPNDEHLWARVRRSISDFLTIVWENGALMGTREEAFYVKCDRTTMSQADLDAGRLIVQIGISPVKPAEFVVIRIGQWTGGSSVDEG